MVKEVYIEFGHFLNQFFERTDFGREILFNADESPSVYAKLLYDGWINGLTVPEAERLIQRNIQLNP